MGNRQKQLHIICERDVGLFSLVQQVIANIPWAIKENRVPVVYFRDNACYWTPNGFRGKDTVWEYYFEPLVQGHPASSIPESVREIISTRRPPSFETGYSVEGLAFVSNHYGDHPDLAGATLSIPYQWDDPSDDLRREAKVVIDRFIRPRMSVVAQVNPFFESYLAGHYVIGIHARGTDATSKQEIRAFRQGSLELSRYVVEIERLLESYPQAKIFVASDEQSSVDYFIKMFGQRVTSYNSVRHTGGEPAGTGPTGWIMPAYIAGDRDMAAQNGEDAVVEYALLSRCDYLVHNGSSLARTVLLNAPDLSHVNTHGQQRTTPRPAAQIDGVGKKVHS